MPVNRYFVALAVFLSLIVPAHAQELWAKTEAGMSVDEVREILPEAKPPTAPGTSPSERNVLLTIPTVNFADENYRVAFFFRDEKLDKVVLNFIGSKSFDDLLPAYNSVVDMLRADYGKEASHRRERSKTIKNEEHTWLSEERSVQTNMTSFLEADAVFAIRYQTKRN